jgi:hypothetical protein
MADHHTGKISIVCIIAALLALVVGCRSLQVSELKGQSVFFPAYESLSASERKKADSLLTVALNQERIYTLMARLKPVSAVGYSFQYHLAKDSTQASGEKNVINISADSVGRMLEELRQLHRIANALSFDDIKFILIPYKQIYKGKRHLQFLVCRQSLIDSVVNVHQSFFGQWGFTSGVDPNTLITTIEFEEKNDRFRAYGYLFGYPEYAVDFFVKADQEYAKTKIFVKRDFLQIPTFARPDGHFTYAIPKGHRTTEIDSTLYRKAGNVLRQYRNTREAFVKDNVFHPVEYLRRQYAK